MSRKAPAPAWQGNEGLRPQLVALDELRPHPRNPRKGDEAKIRESLRRFGQQRPVLALPDGTLVAGHHVWRAARSEGWTHIAVVRSDLAAEEVDAYLLADNRLADLGLYDDAMLAELLAPFAEAGTLEGIGYSPADVEELLAFLDEPAPVEPADPQRPSATGPHERPYATGEAVLFRIVLVYDEATYQRVVERLDAIMDAHGLDSHSAAVAVLADA